ncbi:MAG: tRNA (guanine(10)-N(2))-dimethyltransferase [Candidatus Caldarchaeum sp.]|nr:tRNA (guanine(10)-N(2))-dimethyltransferase [Candidatus Caldarchaeum sp.]
MVERLNEFGFPVKWYSEGRVRFVAPEFPTTKAGEPVAPTKWPIFYNPFSSLSRDLTVVLARTFDRKIKVAEPLAGSGVRSIRLLVETDTVSRALMNDINPYAVKAMKLNAELNGVLDRSEFYHGDAAVFLTALSGTENRVSYVDVDPVGAPSKFVENSLRAVENNGLIGVSATDLAALVGNHPNACYRKYGLLSAKNHFAKETAIRLLASFVVTRAAAMNIAAHPVLSVYHRHFVRVFFKLTRGRARVIKILANIGWIQACDCLRSTVYPLENLPDGKCPRCGGEASVAGPAWVGPLQDVETVEKMLQRSEDLPQAFETITKIRDEVDAVGFYPVDKIAKNMKIQPPSPAKLVEKLKEIGYKASLTHVDPTAVKTDAPLEEIIRLVSAGVC